MLIVISRPELSGEKFLNLEARMMTAMLDLGLDLVHVRKPEAELHQLSPLINLIAWKYRSRIVLHPPKTLFENFVCEEALQYVFRWMRQMGLYRLHIPAWLRKLSVEEILFSQVSVQNRPVVLSTGVHAPGELIDLSLSAPDYDYFLVSPLYDSLSKSGYLANGALWNIAQENEHCCHYRLIAMGGIRVENLQAVRRAGFDGAALMGAIWKMMEVDEPPEWEKRITGYFKFCLDAWNQSKVK